MISSILGLMSFAVATFNTDVKCWSVIGDLWDVLFKFIIENICSHEALIEEIDPEAAISGPEEEEDREDISPAVNPEAAISGPEGEDDNPTSRTRSVSEWKTLLQE
ncbi:hypothetical protein NQZ68_031051 [Dissostichus eleginoides]|nr:hypothetical protein NQZ68_031051 [Dissostichus eleginoides]